MGTAGFRVQKGQEGKMGNVSKDEIKLRGHHGIWGGVPSSCGVGWNGMSQKQRGEGLGVGVLFLNRLNI